MKGILNFIKKSIIFIFFIDNFILQINTVQQPIETVQQPIDQLQDYWNENSLEQENWPSYEYFANEQQGHYNLSLENSVAFAVKDYSVKTSSEDEIWNMKRIIYREDIYYAFVESQSERELYLLLDASWEKYIVLADIRKGAGGNVIIADGAYSYDTPLQWYSYQDVNTADYKVSTHIAGGLYDSIYENAGYHALCAYLNAGEDSEWYVNENEVYIGLNGYLTYICYQNKIENIEMLVDVRNRLYTIIRREYNS